MKPVVPGVWLAFAIASAWLAGCPQLLDDSFEIQQNSDDLGPPMVSGAGGETDGGGAGGAARSSDASAAGGMPAVWPADAGSGSGGAGVALDLDAAAPDGDAGGDAGLDGGGGDADAGGSGGAGTGGTDGSGSGGSGGGPPDPLDALRAPLVHRYEFNGTGTSVVDSKGSADGQVIGTSLTGTGKLTLSGNGQWAELPAGIVSSLSSVTIEAWVDWRANPSSIASEWENVFDFGNTVNGAGVTYVFLTAKSGNTLRATASYTLAGYTGEVRAENDGPLPLATDPNLGTHVAVVVNGPANVISFFIEGQLVMATNGGATVLDLGAILDEHCYLGRATYDADPELEGSLLEFRIYAAALDEAALELSYATGPDAPL